MAIVVQPVDESLFDDVQTVFGRRGQAARCQCQGYRMGWHARHTYLRRTTWKRRSEDEDDPGIWAVTCFVTRAGFRHQGVSRALAGATGELARDRGAKAVEAYPMKPAPGKEVPWGELSVGALSAFLAAGYRVVHVPSLRRAIVRYDF